MRVFIVCPLFPPEPGVSGHMSSQVADELSKQGHDVTVITAFPNRPAGRLYAGYRRTLFVTEVTETGTTVVRCFSIISSKSRALSRFAENISFGVTSGLRLMTLRRPDVIFVNTWPIFAAGIVTAIAQLRGVPIVHSIQDVYPESLVSQGRITEVSLTARLLRRWDGWIAKRGHHVITISERMAAIYRERRGVPAERVHVVQNWADERSITTDVGGAEVRAAGNLPADAFLFVYGGNIGAAAGVDLVVKSFARLNAERDPYLLIAGAGSQLEACQSLAEALAPGRAVFHTPWHSTDTSAVLAAADVLVLPTHGEQSLVSMPSKLISYMLSARPILAQALPNSDLALAIFTAGSGWVVSPGDPEELTRVMEHVMTLPREEIQRMGQAGRSYALNHLTRGACLPAVTALVERAAADGARVGGSSQPTG
jgi:colanic acid biosynthesis glycosyl transferase WcaI